MKFSGLTDYYLYNHAVLEQRDQFTELTYLCYGLHSGLTSKARDAGDCQKKFWRTESL